MLTGEATTLILDSVAVSHTDVAECARDPDLVCPFEEAQGFGDGILVLGGAQLQLQDFALTENARVGLYLYDTEGSGFDENEAITGAPVLDILRGTITGNPYGINFRQGNITPSDFSGKGGLLLTTPPPWMAATARSSLRCPARLRRLRG